jgi:large subunit ribosomal protein L6
MTEEAKSSKLSRIGKKPISLPPKVEVTLKDGMVNVKGPRGTLSKPLVHTTEVVVGKDTVQVNSTQRNGKGRSHKQSLAYHGLMRALLANMVEGVSVGFTKELLIIGTGYKAETSGKKIVLNLGFSHPINYAIPEGIVVKTKQDKTGLILSITGNDKETVGQIASEIRGYRPPDSYKGKGVRYRNEIVRLKAGKK